ncbi:MAG TPA: STM3941 family protein [Pirellulales bacterium]|nr:STM3941 family protein [Pirellulales bacterium]
MTVAAVERGLLLDAVIWRNGTAMENGQTIIPLSKRKILLLVTGCLALGPLSVWVWSIANTQTRYYPLYAQCAAVAGACLSGWGCVYGCLKVFDRRPGLIVDSEGIVDHSSAGSIGRIPWSEITGVVSSEVKGQRLVTIMVAKPEKFVASGGFFVRALNAAGLTETGSPINISANTLQINFNELYSLLTQAFEAHRAARRADG